MLEELRKNPQQFEEMQREAVAFARKMGFNEDRLKKASNLPDHAVQYMAQIFQKFPE